jgi:2-phospho-L-lactate/phosphoenolpyruvate guanylyltransferase
MPHQDGWTVVVPVKGGRQAKSRLHLRDGNRQQLARALAEDTITAIRDCPFVTSTCLVTADVATAEWAAYTWTDVAVIHELPHEDLNSALERTVGDQHTRLGGISLAVVTGDLPALTGDDLAHVICSADAVGGPCLVPDRSDRGTTMLLLPAGTSITMCFGADSAAEHRAAGATVLAAAAGARCDVDTRDDLEVAAAIGLGPRTRAVLESATSTVRWVQATVRTFDDQTHSGTVLLDDGVELPFGADAFATSGLRLLRMGQRVRITTATGGQRVTSLTILTLA